MTNDTTQPEPVTTQNDRVADDRVYVTDSEGTTTAPDGFDVLKTIESLLTTDGDITKLSCFCGGPAAVVIDGTVYTAPESHMPDFLVLQLLIERGVINESDISAKTKAKAALEYVKSLAVIMQAERANFGGASFGDTLGAIDGNFDDPWGGFRLSDTDSEPYGNRGGFRFGDAIRDRIRSYRSGDIHGDG